MSSDEPAPPVWVIRSEDGTEMRVPGLEKVRTWILSGVISGQDEIRRSDHDVDAWRFVADLADLADIVGQMDVSSPTTRVADGPVHEIADLVNVDLSVAPPPLPEDGDLEDAMAPTHAMEIPSEEDIEAMLPGNIVYEVPLEPAEDATVTEMTALDLSDFEDDDPLSPMSRNPAASWNASELEGHGTTPTIEVELPPSILDDSADPPCLDENAIDATSPGLLARVKMQVEAAAAEQQEAAPEEPREAAPEEPREAATEEPREAAPEEPPGLPGDDGAPEEPDNTEPDLPEVRVDDVLTQSDDAGPQARVDLPLSRPMVRKAGAMGGGLEALEQAEHEEQETRRINRMWILFLVVCLAGGAWWALGMNSGGDDPGKDIESSLVKAPETEAPVPVLEPTAETADKEEAGATALEAAAPAPDNEGGAPAPEVEVADKEEAHEQPPAEAMEDEEDAPTTTQEKSAAAPKARREKSKDGRGKAGSVRARTDDERDPPTTRSFDALMRAGRKAEGRSAAEGLGYYQKALAVRPGDPDALGSVGRTLFRSGSNSKAIEVLKRCRSTRSRFGPCMYWLGKAYEKAGQGAEARKLFEKYLSDYPDGSYATKARQRLSP